MYMHYMEDHARFMKRVKSFFYFAKRKGQVHKELRKLREKSVV